jgi:SAM-dependent methyltransferase
MADPTRYFATGWAYDEELARLKLIEQIYDPPTIRRVSNLGLSAGWRCLEVGAGAGSVARWLADRVGPTGKVVAADIDTRFLQNTRLSNLEVREYDIRTQEAERGTYDLVHCRNFLMHFRNAEEIARRMVAALRPGGWLLAEEPDFIGMVAVTRDHADAESFDSFVQRAINFQRSKADYDSGFGRSLPLLVYRLGLVECGNEATTSIVRGGEPHARLYVEGRKRFRTAYIAEGVVTEEEYERFERTLGDPTFAYLENLSVAAWGRRP